MANINTLMDIALDEEFDRLSKAAPGSEEYRAALDGVTRLMDRQLEMIKLENASEEKAEATAIQQKQFKSEKRDRLVKNILTGLGIAAPLGVGIWGTLYTTNWEKDNVNTTSAGKSFFNMILPKRK